MKTLKFTIRDKHITRQDGNAVVAGAVNHYELECAFDEDWNGLTKTVVLENGDVKVELLYTGGLTLPWEVCREGGLLLSVRGTKTLGDGRTQVVRTARMAKPIPVEPGGSEEGQAPSGFTPELAQQVLAVLGDLAALLTTNKSTMVAAINEIYQEAGIESIRFKETDAEGNNVYTVNLSRGESYEIKAPIGKTGPQGAQGIKGDTGQKGDKGEKGEKGDRGEKGDTGATGAKGDKGDPGATGPQGITPTIGENENWYLGNVDTGKPSRGRQGEKGETGAKGEKGDSGVYVGAGDMPEGYNVQIDPSGSGDEIVTAESIESALGYTPADSNEVGQIKEDLSAKLDKPSTAPAVGKILKVTAVNEDGTFTCEWADDNGGAVDDVQVNGTSVVADGVAKIPLAKMGSTGVVKFDAFMPFTFNADSLRLANADEKELTNPRYGYSTNRAITASNYRLAVKLAMCDGKGAAWTDAEKTGAWTRESIIKTAMDDVAVAGAQYYIGEQSAVSIILPDDALVGQAITVVWYNGATAATLSITGTMLAFDYTPYANTRSEINALWDGAYWTILSNEMEVPSDAETT